MIDKKAAFPLGVNMGHRGTKRAIIIVSLCLLSFTLAKTIDVSLTHKDKLLKSGDIIFHKSLSEQSKAIQLATGSPYTHMGIIYERNKAFYVYEAVQPVQLTPLSKWIARGEGRHYVVKRLKDSMTILTPTALKKMDNAGKRFSGKNYDLYFEWSDDRIYCSELVWKIYKEALGIEIGKLQSLREFDLTSDVVKKKMNERYGDNIPLNERVISPAAMFHSDKLILITEQ